MITKFLDAKVNKKTTIHNKHSLSLFVQIKILNCTIPSKYANAIHLKSISPKCLPRARALHYNAVTFTDAKSQIL